MNQNEPQGDSDKTLIEQIAYCARMDRVSAQGFTQKMEQIRWLNTQRGITGVMVWERSLLIVWIEAQADALMHAWQDVLQDKALHSLVQLVHRKQQTQRLFKDWSTQYASRQDVLELLRCAHTQARRHASGEMGADAVSAIASLSVLLDPSLREHYCDEPPVALSPQVHSSQS